MPHQVFISYSSKDKLIADAVCSQLEDSNIRCWVAPRDIMPGLEYGESIMKSIRTCQIMVVILTKQSNSSRHVRKEVERAVSRGLMVIPFRAEDVTPSDAMEYFLSAEHWLDAINPSWENHIGKLCSIIQSVLQNTSFKNTDYVNKAKESETIEVSKPDFRDATPDTWGLSSGIFSKFLKFFHDK